MFPPAYRLPKSINDLKKVLVVELGRGGIVPPFLVSFPFILAWLKEHNNSCLIVSLFYIFSIFYIQLILHFHRNRRLLGWSSYPRLCPESACGIKLHRMYAVVNKLAWQPSLWISFYVFLCGG